MVLFFKKNLVNRHAPFSNLPQKYFLPQSSFRRLLAISGICCVQQHIRIRYHTWAALYDTPITRAKFYPHPLPASPRRGCPPQKKRFTYSHKVMTAPCAQVLLRILDVIINSLGPGYERRRRRRREEGPPWGHLGPHQDHRGGRRDGDRPPRAEEGDALRHRAVRSKGTSDGAGTGPGPKARRPNYARAYH